MALIDGVSLDTIVTGYNYFNADYGWSQVGNSIFLTYVDLGGNCQLLRSDDYGNTWFDGFQGVDAGLIAIIGAFFGGQVATIGLTQAGFGPALGCTLRDNILTVWTSDSHIKMYSISGGSTGQAMDLLGSAVAILDCDLSHTPGVVEFAIGFDRAEISQDTLADIIFRFNDGATNINYIPSTNWWICHGLQQYNNSQPMGASGVHWGPFNAFLNLAGGGEGVEVFYQNYFDISELFSGNAAARFYDVHLNDQGQVVWRYAVLSDPLQGHNGTVASQSKYYSGLKTYPGFAGVSIGVSRNIGPLANYWVSTRAVYSGGVDVPWEVIDGGLLPPESIAVVSNITGLPVAFAVDATGLWGSNWRGKNTEPFAPDASGSLTLWGRSKIYGNPALPPGTLSGSAWTPKTSTGPLGVGLNVFTGPVNTDKTKNKIMWFHDPEPFNDPVPVTVVYLNEIDDNPYLPPSPPPANTALGSSVGSVPKFDIARLQRAATTHTDVPNPNNSPGCSPLLRELLLESGAPFTVASEVRNDGQAIGHQGGNALDVMGVTAAFDPDTQKALTDQQRAEVLAIVNFLKKVPSLFSLVVHYDSDPNYAFYVWDGKVVTANQIPISINLSDPEYLQVHIQSSWARLTTALHDAAMIATLGGASYTPDPVNGVPQPPVQAFAGTGQNRQVYVNADLLSDPVTVPKAIASHIPGEQRKVTFW